MLAGQGSTAPVCVVSKLTLVETTLQYRAAVGLGCAEVMGTLPDDATVGDLARALSRSCGTTAPRLHLVLHGMDSPISPWCVQTPLVNFIL